MKYIEKLYLSSAYLSRQRFTNDSKYCKLMQQALDVYDKLSQTLDDDKKELLERISELHGQIDDIMSVDSYTSGFRDGARLMIDILLGENENLRSQ